MKLLAILMGVAGIWFLASAATENGLLPSGHGMGRVSEVIIGLGLIAISIYRLVKGDPRRSSTSDAPGRQ